MNRTIMPAASSRIDRLLRQEPVVWLSSVFLATYSQVIRIVPTRFLPWHGRMPRGSQRIWPTDRRLASSIRRVAATFVSRPGLAAG